jgi:uncharacterized protein
MAASSSPPRRRCRPELEPFRLQLPPHLVHHLLAFASLYVGESATMASEAAILGTPSLYVSSSFRGYIQEQEERYGLSRWCTDPEQAVEAAVALARDPAARAHWAPRRERMLAEMEDVTGVVVRLVEEARACRRRDGD